MLANRQEGGAKDTLTKGYSSEDDVMMPVETAHMLKSNDLLLPEDEFYNAAVPVPSRELLR